MAKASEAKLKETKQNVFAVRKLMPPFLFLFCGGKEWGCGRAGETEHSTFI